MRQIGESMCGNLLWFHAERILLAFVPCLPWLSRGRMTQNDSYESDSWIPAGRTPEEYQELLNQDGSNRFKLPMVSDETWWNMTVRYAHLRSPQIWSDRAIERCNLLVRWRFFIYDNKPSLWNDHPTICSNLIMRLNNNYNTYKYTWSYYIIYIYNYICKCMRVYVYIDVWTYCCHYYCSVLFASEEFQFNEL